MWDLAERDRGTEGGLKVLGLRFPILSRSLILGPLLLLRWCISVLNLTLRNMGRRTLLMPRELRYRFGSWCRMCSLWT